MSIDTWPRLAPFQGGLKSSEMSVCVSPTGGKVLFMAAQSINDWSGSDQLADGISFGENWERAARFISIFGPTVNSEVSVDRCQ